MRQVIEERAASPDFAVVPGGKTGLLCRELRGKKDTPVYKVDTALLAELRAHEQQAAQEIGQWQSKHVVEEKKLIDATPEAIALGLFCSVETLLEMKRKILELRSPVAVIEAAKVEQG